MSSPAHSHTLTPATSAAAPRAWADCPRCGEHWPGGALYCGNCGWAPDSAAGPAVGAGAAAAPARQERSVATGLLLAALVAALVLVLWGWASDRDATPPPLASGAAAAGSVPASTSAPTPTSAPAPAPAPAPIPAPAPAPAAAVAVALAVSAAPAAPVASVAASPSDTQPVPARAPAGHAGLDLQADRFVRDWLAAEAESADGPAALRPFYADTVAYRGHRNADWALISADKARFMRRWPQRHYDLLALRGLDQGTAGAGDGADREVRATLHVRWRLEQQGRWRRGESVTVLTLRRVDGRWRIVAEDAA